MRARISRSMRSTSRKFRARPSSSGKWPTCTAPTLRAMQKEPLRFKEALTASSCSTMGNDGGAFRFIGTRSAGIRFRSNSCQSRFAFAWKSYAGQRQLRLLTKRLLLSRFCDGKEDAVVHGDGAREHGGRVRAGNAHGSAGAAHGGPGRLARNGIRVAGEKRDARRFRRARPGSAQAGIANENLPEAAVGLRVRIR